MIDLEELRRIALSFAGAYESPTYGGRPSWRTPKGMFAWLRDKPEALVVWVESLEAKEALLTGEPRKFFTTAHYDGYPVVLCDTAELSSAEATELLRVSWMLRAPASLTRPKKARARAKRP